MMEEDTAWELDHLFVWTTEGAPEVDILIDAGLTEGAPNTHPGQGTSNRRFFFQNAFLELLWVHDRNEAESEAIRGFHFWERWSKRNSGACPFGFIFRPRGTDRGEPPFSTWEYCPAYMPRNLAILVGRNAATLSEPMLFCMPFGMRPDLWLQGHEKLLRHRPGFTEIKELCLSLPHVDEISSELNAVVNTGLIRLSADPQCSLEIILEGTEDLDCRPALPIIFRRC